MLDCQNLNFMATIYKFTRNVGTDFLFQLKTFVSRTESYNMNVMRQTVCIDVNSIMVDAVALLPSLAAPRFFGP